MDREEIAMEKILLLAHVEADGSLAKPALEAYQRFLSMSQGKSPNQEWQARQRVKLLERELEKK